MDAVAHLDLLALLSRCVQRPADAVLVGTFFLTGLIGGFGHCAPMCGPLVLLLTQPPGRKAAAGSGFRSLASALAPYQLGRLSGYALLGALAGGLGGAVVVLTKRDELLALTLLLAAALFLAHGLRLLVPGLPRWRAPPLVAAQTLASRLIAPVLRLPWRVRCYGLGMATGLLPCGFLYAVLAGAAGTGSAMGGAAAMAAFALGTMPSLLAVALIGSGAAGAWGPLAARFTGPLYLVNAVILLGLAVRAASGPHV